VNVIHYSVALGGYDKIQPIVRERGVTYILFTDAPVRMVPQPWVRMPMPPRPTKFPSSFRRWSRLPKILPHKFLPPHDLSIYSDCNLAFKGVPVKPWAVRQTEKRPLAIFQHPSRDCTYKEAETCIRLNFDHVKEIVSQAALLKSWKFPINYGLTENCFILRRNTPDVAKFNEEWWADYEQGSMRDQLSFMPAIWRCAFKDKLHIMPGNSRANQFYTQVRHLKDRRVGGDKAVTSAQLRVLKEMNRCRSNIANKT
jgi:hypothetical protein